MSIFLLSLSPFGTSWCLHRVCDVSSLSKCFGTLRLYTVLWGDQRRNTEAAWETDEVTKLPTSPDWQPLNEPFKWEKKTALICWSHCYFEFSVTYSLINPNNSANFLSPFFSKKISNHLLQHINTWRVKIRKSGRKIFGN